MEGSPVIVDPTTGKTVSDPTSGNVPERPDYEKAKEQLGPTSWEASVGRPIGAPPEGREPDYQDRNFAPPAGPPDRKERKIAESLQPLVKTLEEIVESEGLVLDLCLEKTIEIVKFHHERGLYGTDLLTEHGSQGFSHATLVSMGIMLTPKFYEEVQKSIEIRRPELEKLVKEALEKKASDASPTIIRPA